jgi:uncharacterized protein involved in response to NO
MVSSAEQMRSYKGPVLFSFGFRPFFLAGAIMAALTPMLTALTLSGILEIEIPGGIIAWHGHEMVYGYLSAVITGFILTAVPNWTGRMPLLGARLMGLAALWVAGRIVMLTPEMFGAGSAVIDGAFLLVVDLFLWREVIAGKNWRNAPVCILILLLAAGNLIWHVETMQGSNGVFGLHFGIGVIAILLALIGGRVTPSFTRNWLAKTGKEPIEAPFSMFDKLAIGALIISISLWLAAPLIPATGIMLLLAGLLHFIRLARWQGWKTVAEPLVLILHIGYFWLASGITLLGLSVLAPATVPAVNALHALTAGAMGVMTLAVMTRAVRGHTGRALQADAVTIVIYALVNLGAFIRVGAPLLPLPYANAVLLAGAVWGSAFVVFAIVYGRYLLSPRLRSA